MSFAINENNASLQLVAVKESENNAEVKNSQEIVTMHLENYQELKDRIDSLGNRLIFQAKQNDEIAESREKHIDKINRQNELLEATCVLLQQQLDSEKKNQKVLRKQLKLAERKVESLEGSIPGLKTTALLCAAAATACAGYIFYNFWDVEKAIEKNPDLIEKVLN